MIVRVLAVFALLLLAPPTAQAQLRGHGGPVRALVRAAQRLAAMPEADAAAQAEAARSAHPRPELKALLKAARVKVEAVAAQEVAA